MPDLRPPVRSPEDFDADAFDQSAVAVRLASHQNDVERPFHHHRKGQLILALHGAVTCEVPQALWLVPPQHAVWIPSGMLHSCRATSNAHIYFLFLEPNAVAMPEKCCTLGITPLVTEMIKYLSEQEAAYLPNSPTDRLVTVLLEQISNAPIEKFRLPISNHPKLKKISDAWTANPSDRTTLSQWSERLAISERSLARLVENSTGLTFGRWRQQLHLIVALSQLSEGIPVQTIAGNLGYDSVTAFITMFKKALGKSPAQYFSSVQPSDF